MMHNDRTWCLTPAESAEDLARKLTEMTWCCCTAFAIDRYLWLNDATSPEQRSRKNFPVFLQSSRRSVMATLDLRKIFRERCDGAQEYAVLFHKESDGSFLQIESITMSWCSYDEALSHLQRTLRGQDDRNEWVRPVQPTLQTAAEHGRCPHCA